MKSQHTRVMFTDDDLECLFVEIWNLVGEKPGERANKFRELCVHYYQNANDEIALHALRRYLHALAVDETAHSIERDLSTYQEEECEHVAHSLMTLWDDLTEPELGLAASGVQHTMKTRGEILRIATDQLLPRGPAQPGQRLRLFDFFVHAFTHPQHHTFEMRQRLVCETMRSVTSRMRPEHILEWLTSLEKRREQLSSGDMFTLTRELWMAHARKASDKPEDLLRAQLILSTYAYAAPDLAYLNALADRLVAMRSAARDLLFALADGESLWTRWPQGYQRVLPAYELTRRLQVDLDYEREKIVAAFLYNFEAWPVDVDRNALRKKAFETVVHNVRLWAATHPGVGVIVRVNVGNVAQEADV